MKKWNKPFIEMLDLSETSEVTWCWVQLPDGTFTQKEGVKKSKYGNGRWPGDTDPFTSDPESFCS